MNGQRLLYQRSLVLSRTSPNIMKLLHEFYGSAIRGNSDFLKIHQCLVIELYWARMKKDVEEMVARCDVCHHAINT